METFHSLDCQRVKEKVESAQSFSHIVGFFKDQRCRFKRENCVPLCFSAMRIYEE
jgi:hypothetical protein